MMSRSNHEVEATLVTQLVFADVPGVPVDLKRDHGQA